MKKIYDKDFRYVPAAATDIRKTFARVRREDQAKKKAEREHQTISILRKRANG